MHARSALVLALGFVACAATRPIDKPPSLSSGAAPSPSLFDFHVGFWVNLHQRLYAESGPRAVPDPLRAATGEEQAAWDAALAFYRQRYVDRGLLTLLENEELVRIDRELRAAETRPDLARANVPAEVRATLESAAAVYRRAGWPEDERADRHFIARVTPLVQRFGPSLAPALARAYETPWPSAPVRVDVATFAGPVGAYTIESITIASRDPRHEGNAALEILFHESSHLLIDPVRRALFASSEAQGKPVPRTLWHAVLFFATGELVRRQLGGDYVPYADRNGLWQRVPDWTRFRPILGRVWVQFLDGKITMRAATDEVVAEGARDPE